MSGCSCPWLIILSLVLNNTNIQALGEKAGSMSDSLPLITLVKAKEVDDRPDLSERHLGLEQTLSMLCSFLSLDDFLQFLQSDIFVDFSRTSEPWIQFELGLYTNHTKTLQLIPEQRQITLVDEAMTGAIEDGIWRGEADESMEAVLARWIQTVASEPQ